MRPATPSIASISRIIVPFPIPPKLGLQEHTPMLESEGVINAVRAPDRAAAADASAPAWPPPITTTSYGLYRADQYYVCKGNQKFDQRIHTASCQRQWQIHGTSTAPLSEDCSPSGKEPLIVLGTPWSQAGWLSTTAVDLAEQRKSTKKPATFSVTCMVLLPG